MNVFIKDSLRASVEAASGGAQTVLYDDKGFPSVMQIIPKFNIEDVMPTAGITTPGTGTHPAFIVGGVEKSQIFIAAYVGSVVDGRAVSFPGKPPQNYTDYDQSKAACVAKGPGWHMMTNLEWAAIALWCVKNGFQPRGNTNYRRAFDAVWETGRSIDGLRPGTTSGDGRTLAGSGPASWNHNNRDHGIADMVGNVWEWMDGFKIKDGQIFMPNDNDYAMPEASWPAQGVYFDASAGPGDGNGAAVNGTPILSNTIAKYSETPTPAGGGDDRDLDYTHIPGATGWQQTGLSAGYGSSVPLAKRQLMIQAGIAPKMVSSDTPAIGLNGAVWVRNYGERVPFRGGGWSNGANAGLGALNLSDRRSYSGYGIGFRPAFIL